jgi:hypothetical protein
MESSQPVSIRSFAAEKVGALTVGAWGLVFLFAGLLVRLPVVHGYSMLIDDGATLMSASLPMDKLVENRLRMGHIPVFFVLFKAWTSLAGWSVVALRVPSLVFSLLAIPLVGLLCAPFREPRAAVLGMGIAVFHATLLRYAAELRMYSWMMVFGPLMLALLMSHLRGPRWWKTALAGGLHLFYLTLHVSAFFYSLPAFLFAALLAPRGSGGLRRRDWAGYWSAFAVPVAIVLPVMLYLLNHVDLREHEKFTAMNPHRQLLACFYELVNGVDMGGDLFKQIVIGIVMPALGLTVLRLRDAAAGLTPARWRIALLYILVGFASPVMAYGVTMAGPEAIGFARYYVTGTPLLIAAIGLCIVSARWERGWGRRAVVLLFLVSLGITGEMSFYRVRRILGHEETGLHRLVQKLNSEAPDGAVLLLPDQGATRRIVEVYLGGSARRFKLLPINSEWESRAISRKLGEEADPRGDIHLLFYREVDERIVGLVEKHYGGRVEEIRQEHGGSVYLHMKPRPPEESAKTAD